MFLPAKQQLPSLNAIACVLCDHFHISELLTSAITTKQLIKYNKQTALDGHRDEQAPNTLIQTISPLAVDQSAD